MPINSASPVGIALTGAQKLLTSPTARKLMGEVAKAAGDIGVQVAREQLPGLVRRISSSAAGPRGAGPGVAAQEPRSAKGLVANALAAAAPEMASLRTQVRPLRQQALAEAGLALRDALLAATRQRRPSAGVQVMGDKLGTIASQLQRDAQPIAAQLVGRATTELAAVATRAFVKAMAGEASAPTIQPEESASPVAASIIPATEGPDPV